MPTTRGQRDLAQDAIAALRAAPVRRRRHLPLGLRDAGSDMAEGVVEFAVGVALLLVGCGAAAAVRWGWQHSPPVTVTVIVGVAVAEAFGVLSAVRALRRGQGVRWLPGLVLGLAVIAGWGVGTWLFYASR